MVETNEQFLNRIKAQKEKEQSALDIPVRNKQLFEELRAKKEAKQADNLEKQLEREMNKLQSLKKFQNAKEEEQNAMIKAKEKEVHDKCAGTPLNQVEILTILKDESSLFHCLNLADTETDEQKELYIFDWDRGIYTKNATFLYTIISKLNPTTTEKMDKAIAYDLKKYAAMYFTRKAEKSGRYIAFKNGLWDGEKGQFSEHFNPDIVLLSAIPFNYNPNAQEPIKNGTSITGKHIEWHGSDMVEMFKNGDDKRETLFYEVTRAIMGSKRNAFLFAWNEKGNGGKSTIGELFCILAGKEGTLRTNIDALGTRFVLANIERKKLIYGDDMAVGGKMSPHATATMKTLSTGDEISSEQKGRDVKNSFFSGIIYQCSNVLFTTDDKTGGIVRRCIFLPFKEIPRDETCGAVIDWIKEPEFIEWIIKETLNHCPNAPEQYTEPTNNDEYKQEFKENNDPFISFVSDYIEPITEQCERIPLVFIYRYLFRQFTDDYPSLEKATVQEVNNAIKDKMKVLGYDLKKRSRINESQFHPTYKDGEGNKKPYYDLMIKRNSGRSDFNNVYIKGAE